MVAEERVAVGRVVSVNMAKGELRVRSLSDVPGRMGSLRRIVLVSRSGEEVDGEVASSRLYGDRAVLVMKEPLAGDAPEKLRGALVTVGAGERARLPGGHYYVSDLVGMAVYSDSGEELGELVKVFPTGSNDVFEVKGPGGELLVPATREVVLEVDVPGKRMVVHLLDGMDRQ